MSPHSRVIRPLAVVIGLLAAPLTGLGAAVAMPPGAVKDLPPPPADRPDPPLASEVAVDPGLRASVDNPARPAADTVRDVYRHPYETLKFWGVKPGLVVIDLQPGGGYWTEILAPYAMKTGGVYVAGVADLANPKLSDAAKAGRAKFETKFADAARYGQIRYVGFGSVSGPMAAPNSVDLIITSREIHNWIAGGYLDRALAQAYAALKPGGILAVEEHRADPRPQVAGAKDGYVATGTVVDAARQAGFTFAGASEINANPKDTKDYPFGVWTLPPTRQSSAGGPPLSDLDRAKYDAVGESDRMTLRFRKPV
jgi:predicted methyltransferase